MPQYAAPKSRIRSIRMTDELYNLVDSQPGATWSDKWATLVTTAYLELPDKQAELEHLNRQIATRRDIVADLTMQTIEMQHTLDIIQQHLMTLNRMLTDITSAQS